MSSSGEISNERIPSKKKTKDMEKWFYGTEMLRNLLEQLAGIPI